MVGTTCEFFLRHFVWKVFLIRLLYKTFKEKLKIQRRYLFQLGFGFTTTSIMIVYESVMKSGTNKAGKGVKITKF